jgi:hypothetical protein
MARQAALAWIGRLTVTHRRQFRERRTKTEMNPATEVKTNPNPAPEFAIVNGGAAAATASALSFPIGYYDLHPDVSINFQLNRFYGWAGDDSMLTEMQGLASVNDYPTFTKIVPDLGEKALARHEVLKGAYYLRLVFELFSFNSTRRRPPGWSLCPRACLPRVEMTNQDPFLPLR